MQDCDNAEKSGHVKKFVILISVILPAIVLIVFATAAGAQHSISPVSSPMESPASIYSNLKMIDQVSSNPSEIPGLLTTTLTNTVNLPVMFKPQNLLFADDFSNPNSGWPIDDDGVIRRSYIGGEYEILLRNHSWWAGQIAPASGFGDYTLSAVMRREVGSTSDIGLVFDFLDWSNFYVFAIDPTVPWFGLILVNDGSAEVLVPTTTSVHIKTGNNSNHLQVERDGDSISLFINGQHLATVNSGSFAGDLGVGFYVESDNDAPAAIRYDNISVRELVNGSSTITQTSSIPLRSGAAEQSFFDFEA